MTYKELIKRLAELYPTINASKRILDFAEIKYGSIQFDSASITNWSIIVNKVRLNNNDLKRLLQEIAEEVDDPTLLDYLKEKEATLEAPQKKALKEPSPQKVTNGILNIADNKSWFIHSKDKESCKYLNNLYTWDEAQKAAPEGYQLPSCQDFWDLTQRYGGVCNRLKGQRKTHTFEHGTETYRELAENIGFVSVFNGMAANSTIETLSDNKEYCYFWTNTAVNTNEAWVYYFHRGSKGFYRTKMTKEKRISCCFIEK